MLPAAWRGVKRKASARATRSIGAQLSGSVMKIPMRGRGAIIAAVPPPHRVEGLRKWRRSEKRSRRAHTGCRAAPPARELHRVMAVLGHGPSTSDAGNRSAAARTTDDDRDDRGRLYDGLRRIT